MSKVTIENDRGRLRLRWQYLGKRYGMSVGVDGTPIGMAIAKRIAADIELDIHTQRFDRSLMRYKPVRHSKNATEVAAPVLFERFTLAMRRQKGLFPGSLARYRGCLHHLRRSLNVPADHIGEFHAANFAAVLAEQVSSRTAKEYLWLLQACWSWARGQYRVVEENPWSQTIGRLRPEPRQRTKPFTQAEVKSILEAFRTGKTERHYYLFVVFLFSTGCRFGEAAGLLWEHLALDFSSVWIGESMTREGTRKATKTGKDRTVQLSPTVGGMLKAQYRQLKPEPSALVFPAPKGGPMNDKHFNRRVWKPVIERLGIPYRKPYGTRHTAISHALARGANPLQVAQQSGHDPQVLFTNYASVIEQQSVFVEFVAND